MKILSYAWMITINVVTLFIALLLYSTTNTRFEIIIISLLLLIYLRIVSSSTAIAILIVENGMSKFKQFLHILKILKRNDPAYNEHKELMNVFESIDKDKKKDDFDEYAIKPTGISYFEADFCEDEDSQELLSEREALVKSMTIRYYVGEAFSFLIYALAVWKIITTLL